MSKMKLEILHIGLILLAIIFNMVIAVLRFMEGKQVLRNKYLHHSETSKIRSSKKIRGTLSTIVCKRSRIRFNDLIKSLENGRMDL